MNIGENCPPLLLYHHDSNIQEIPARTDCKGRRQASAVVSKITFFFVSLSLREVRMPFIFTMCSSRSQNGVVGLSEYFRNLISLS